MLRSAPFWIALLSITLIFDRVALHGKSIIRVAQSISEIFYTYNPPMSYRQNFNHRIYPKFLHSLPPCSQHKNAVVAHPTNTLKSPTQAKINGQPPLCPPRHGSRSSASINRRLHFLRLRKVPRNLFRPNLLPPPQLSQPLNNLRLPRQLRPPRPILLSKPLPPNPLSHSHLSPLSNPLLNVLSKKHRPRLQPNLDLRSLR